MNLTPAQEDDAGFRRPVPVVPAPRIGATGKRGRKRYGKGGTPHVRPQASIKSRTHQARATRRRQAAFRSGPVAGCQPGIVCWHRTLHYAWSQGRAA